MLDSSQSDRPSQIRRVCFGFGVTVVLLLVLTVSEACNRRDVPEVNDRKAPPDSPAETVVLRLRIIAADRLEIDATKQVPLGIGGLDAMKRLIALESRTYSGLGEFVTSLCGVEASTDQYWALYVDGEYSQVDIASIQIDKDTDIEWKLQDQ